ncbi:Tetratricopeptide repeat-containing domain protein [Acididesulfobacillus acetoxydans]|uniref:Tetratricopeptide repeat n=1 Tax=Acididesulfobacillus acetoxydans TaxID=1561005 RepID=A0A8S0WKU4_9FIRM|nr:tetratricopeptide repeat protein [Acididesulfobacillus acetoxydans]CAA7599614.1 Tetratricopeptide repeat-containing domain protein [Acididesulfobacillus acetoxydans]CEJ06475.1 Tetratricopeptide repeat [Acididesulfobacillus acetoxydans]
MGKWKWSLGALIVVLALGLVWGFYGRQPQGNAPATQKTPGVSAGGSSQHPYTIASPGAEKYAGDTAWKNYVKKAEGNPKDAAAQVDAAVASFVNKKYTDAVTYYKKAIALDPKNAQYPAYLGNVYFWGLNNPALAESYYRKAVQLDPTYGDGWFLLGRFYVAEGKKSEAKSVLSEGLKKVPKSSPQYARLEAYAKTIK